MICNMRTDLLFVTYINSDIIVDVFIAVNASSFLFIYIALRLFIAVFTEKTSTGSDKCCVAE